MRRDVFWGVMVGVLLAARLAAAAADPVADKCAAGKTVTAGKYAACIAAAESSLAATGDQAAYDADTANCGLKFIRQWARLETAAVVRGSSCPAAGDSEVVKAFVGGCVQDVADACMGGVLPDYPNCIENLALCNSDLDSATDSLVSCNASISSANASIAACAGSLSNCTTALAGADGCVGKLFTCSEGLSACNLDLGEANAGLGACGSALSICNSDLGATAGAVDACTSSLELCSSSLVAGSMPNNGSVKLTPGTTNQPILLGYHDGTGFCAGDVDLLAENIRYGVSLFGVTGASSAFPGTGQTTAYASGSDGDLRRGPARSFVDHGDGTITDAVTGLMWEKKSQDGSIHDMNNMYSWSTDAVGMDGTLATDFLAALNAGAGFAGHNDWRIPNRMELLSITNMQAYDPAVYGPFFRNCTAGCNVFSCSCTQSGSYWSSTTNPGYPDYAWGVAFGDGDTVDDYKTLYSYARAVRGGS